MNKAQFIESVCKTGKYCSKAEAARAYSAVLTAFTGRMSKGNAKDRVVRLPELGTFQMKLRKARKGRNPQTGKTINIPARKVVTFKGGKSLKKSL